MSTLNEAVALETLTEELIEQDNKGLLDNEVQAIAEFYNLHQDDDRVEIIYFIAEGIYYNYYS